MKKLAFNKLYAQLIGGLLAVALCNHSAIAATDEQTAQSWDRIMQGLEAAQVSLTDPRFFPPQSSDRNLAEGYRYLLGHLGRMIEAEMRLDPRFPEFHRSMDMLRKWTAENPDTMYLKAPIDGTEYHKVTGQAANTQEWKISERGLRETKAPRLVTFQTITGIPGATGELKEMAQCKNQTLDFVKGLLDYNRLKNR